MIAASAELLLPTLPDAEILLYRIPGPVAPAAGLLSSRIVGALDLVRQLRKS